MPQRQLPVGAEVLDAEGVHFRVWAPRRSSVAVVLNPDQDESTVPLSPQTDGYFSGMVGGARAGTLYKFRLEDEATLYPDPASRFQPEGPHGPSQVIDPKAFRWTDGAWRGVPPDKRVLYELHVGTFTREGTWQAAARELSELARLGITVIEVMPVADFPGRFGWGYDGVNLYAPTRLYGEPDDFRRFVDRAHAEGLGVILDVVYNHFGPDGCYLRAFSDDYFTDRYENEWGDPINFDGDNAGPVREFFTANAGYWVQEFHLDGLRLDATQQIFDSSADNVIAAIDREVRRAGGNHLTYIVSENEPQDVRLVRSPDKGGYGNDALWNDDFHHTAMVALTGHNEAYYTDYSGTPQEFISTAKWGFLYQGQRYKWQNKPRGTPSFGLPALAFVNYIQNHDQVANSAFGARIHTLTSPGRHRAITALLLLAPQTPLLFQGQEFNASAPFLYFADHGKDLAAAVRKGRAEFLKQFPGIATAEMQAQLGDPGAPETFERCKLDFAERGHHVTAYELHRDLLSLRRTDEVFSGLRRTAVEGAVLSERSFVLRFLGAEGDDRLLAINLGRTHVLDIAPEPLLAPPAGSDWEMVWSSVSAKYGGEGASPLDVREGWSLPGEAALVFKRRSRA